MNKATKRKRGAAVGSSDLVRHPGLYRAKLSCKIGRDALEGKTDPPGGTTAIEYALYNLLHAVEDIATAMMPNTALGKAHEK